MDVLGVPLQPIARVKPVKMTGLAVALAQDGRDTQFPFRRPRIGSP